MKRTRSLILLAGLMLLAPGMGRAQSGYNIQSLVKAGDTIAGVQLAPFNEPDFQIVGLNDNGELVFYALNTTGQRVLFDFNGGKFTRIAGEGDTIGGVVLSAFQGGGDGPTFNGQTTFLGFDANGKDLLFQYAGGKTTLIAAPGMPAPGGHFGTGSDWGITKPVSMNWQGNVVFQAYLTPTTPYPPGIRTPTQPAVFLWNAAKQQLAAVAGPGTKLGDLTILSAQGSDAPAINNNGEMVVNVTGSFSAVPYYFQGLLFVGADGKSQPILQFDQKLPDGSTSSGGGQPFLNDAGVVAFRDLRHGAGDGYYLRDRTTGSVVGPIMMVGQDISGAGKVFSIEALVLDPFTDSGLFQVRLNAGDGPRALYQFLAFPDTPPVQGTPSSTAGAHIADLQWILPSNSSDPWSEDYRTWLQETEYKDKDLVDRGLRYEQEVKPLSDQLHSDEDELLKDKRKGFDQSTIEEDEQKLWTDFGTLIYQSVSGTHNHDALLLLTPTLAP